MQNKKFAVLILTHGRPEKVITYNLLRKCGYTGRIVIVIDNEDKTSDEYKKKYGDEVIIFDKEAISKTFDTADTSDDRRSIVYARNASFGIAKELGLEYFVQLDDDYNEFIFKYDYERKYRTGGAGIKNMDLVFDIFIDYLKAIPACSIAFAQNGEFIGGSSTHKTLKPKRKAMNSFFCCTDRPFQFLGRINEDVNTYSHGSSIGMLFFTILQVSLRQQITQSNTGGMTDLYLDSGTYLKSFYSIIFHPSGVKISTIGQKNFRIHHSVKWNNTAPKIIRQSNRK